MQSALDRSQTVFSGLLAPKTRHAHPVWRESARVPVRFVGLPKKEAVRLFHDARRLERRTRSKGKQDGTLGRNGLAVLHALLFDFLDYASGQLDPSYAAIAHKAAISVSSVWRGLRRLKKAGVVNWIRRCRESVVDGRWCLEQESNAYAVISTGAWRSCDPAGSRETRSRWPHREEWGAVSPLPGALETAAQCSTPAAIVKALEMEPDDPLASALARLARASGRV
jgi:hypothetical protein